MVNNKTKGIISILLLLLFSCNKPNNINDDYLSALGKGDLDAVENFILQGVAIDTIFNNGSTPIHIAIEKGNKKLVELLINKGADVNSKDIVGWTPLHKTAKLNEYDIAELLINESADVNSPGINGWTPLLRAIGFAHVEMVALLLENGADINVYNKPQEWGPLHWTAWAGVGRAKKNNSTLPIAKILVKAGVDPFADSNSGGGMGGKGGKTPLELAKHFGNRDVENYLLSLKDTKNEK